MASAGSGGQGQLIKPSKSVDKMKYTNRISHPNNNAFTLINYCNRSVTAQIYNSKLITLKEVQLESIQVTH